MGDTDNSADILQMEDLTDRIEELEELREEAEEEAGEGHMSCVFGRDEREEIAALESIVSDFKGYGGDYQWRGDWYPASLIRDSYFEDYAEQLAEDIGAIDPDASWPLGCIDWEKAARELQQDYTSGEFDGVTYWGR